MPRITHAAAATADVLFYDCWSSRVQTDIFITGLGTQHTHKAKHRERRVRKKQIHLDASAKPQSATLLDRKKKQQQQELGAPMITIKQRASSHLSRL